MKISENDLKQIIAEELEKVVQEDEQLEELFGFGKKETPHLLLRNKIESAKKALKDLYFEAGKQKEMNIKNLTAELLKKLEVDVVTNLGKAYREVGEFASYMKEENDE